MWMPWGKHEFLVKPRFVGTGGEFAVFLRDDDGDGLLAAFGMGDGGS